MCWCAYITKPLAQETLEATLSKWLTGSKPSHKPATGNKNKKSPASGLLDTGVIASLRDLMGENYSQILQKYMDESAKLHTVLKESWQRGDLKAVSQAAHSLKSSSQYVGAVSLKDMFAAIEAGAKQDDKEMIAQTLKAVEDTYPQVRHAIGEILDKEKK